MIIALLPASGTSLTRSVETLLSMIPTYKYEIVYFEDYILPFTKNKVKEDFDIDLHDNTHVKILLKRKD